MPIAEHVERLIFQLFKRKLKRAGDELSREELSQSRGFLPDGFTSADVQRGMEALIAKGYFRYYTHQYRHFFQLTPDGVTALREHTTRKPLPSRTLAGQQEGSGAAPATSMASKTAMPPAPPLYVHDEETPAGPVGVTQTEDEIAGEPIRPQPQPKLMDAWQQARDDERQAFVAIYRDELRRLLAAHDEPQQKQYRRATASKR